MIIEPTRHADGTFSLTRETHADLRKRGHESCQVHSALLKLYETVKRFERSLSKENNLPPCPTCGGLVFIATGNCHACANCGESQGCS